MAIFQIRTWNLREVKKYVPQIRSSLNFNLSLKTCNIQILVHFVCYLHAEKEGIVTWPYSKETDSLEILSKFNKDRQGKTQAGLLSSLLPFPLTNTGL